MATGCATVLVPLLSVAIFGLYVGLSMRIEVLTRDWISTTDGKWKV